MTLWRFKTTSSSHDVKRATEFSEAIVEIIQLHDDKVRNVYIVICSPDREDFNFEQYIDLVEQINDDININKFIRHCVNVSLLHYPRQLA